MSVNTNQRSDIAEQISAMLGRILAKPDVSPSDDFFDLGGDSLAATELMTAIEARFGVVVDPVEIYEQPKIRLFAQTITKLAQGAKA